MAKCGHIFCLPCLIRYLHSVDDATPIPEKKPRWKKCPICWDSIYLSHARPVRWFVGQEGDPPREGEDVVLRLVKRQAGRTLALPRDDADSYTNDDDIPWFFAPEVMDYARVMRGTEDYMVEQYGIEIEQMQEREQEDELLYGDETKWTKRAVAAVHEAKARLQGLGNAPGPGPEPIPQAVALSDPAESEDRVLLRRSARLSEKLYAGGKGTDLPRVDLVPTSRLKGRLPAVTGDGGSAYYFYQSLLHYYLSPLDIRILRAAFGSYASFPTTLLPRVDHVSTGHVIDDDLRKRAKYLAHLPAGCEVGFLECDWTDVVEPEILEQFKSDIEHRRKRNQEKEIREEKDRIRAEKQEEDQRWAAVRKKRSSIIQESGSGSDFLAPDATEYVNLSSTERGLMSSSPPWPGSSQLRTGSGFASLASPSTSPVAPRTVWGTAVIPSSSPLMTAAEHQEPEVPVDDGWLGGWEQGLLQELDLIDHTQAPSAEGSSSRQAGENAARRKKGKKITLMSTNVRRGA
ncbi:MAG: hypothetical protein M1826_002632 [Phylliscum demangeonii]|nr:MAG: hypothetical protein M1826_002632 [Phylliscum demangeonii]